MIYGPAGHKTPFLCAHTGERIIFRVLPSATYRYVWYLHMKDDRRDKGQHSRFVLCRYRYQISIRIPTVLSEVLWVFVSPPTPAPAQHLDYLYPLYFPNHSSTTISIFDTVRIGRTTKCVVEQTIKINTDQPGHRLYFCVLQGCYVNRVCILWSSSQSK